MNYNRRKFLGRLGQFGLLAGTSLILPPSLKAFHGQLLAQSDEAPELIKLSILHTNDVHSRIEPFPMDGGRNQGKAGAARRAALINKIREEEKHVLLLDAGDMFQGTPYFNYFKGELELKLMSAMGYEAGTLGNHDFDAGIENLEKQLKAHANFPILNCNYNFEDTPMQGLAQPYSIIKKGPLKIGLTGVGIELQGLVPAPLYGQTQYQDPQKALNKMGRFLKEEKKCDYVICLSHLGYSYKHNKISDLVLAQNSEAVDLIIGGHTHTFLEQPTLVQNPKGEEVLVSQAGWAGILLGRIDVYFEPSKKKKCISCQNTIIE